VRQFIGLLRGLAITGNSAVLIAVHPSLTGISSGTGLSGSRHGTTACEPAPTSPARNRGRHRQPAAPA
jgi:hypothetical protein